MGGVLGGYAMTDWKAYQAQIIAAERARKETGCFTISTSQAHQCEGCGAWTCFGKCEYCGRPK